MSQEKITKELICQVFIDIVNDYFLEITQTPSETGLPYLKSKDQDIVDDFTGVIAISGSHKGVIYVTGSETLFRDLIKIILGLGDEDKPDKEQITDMAGEVANTISGNARKVFGSDFMISVPLILEGKLNKVSLGEDIPIFIIPIKWKEHKANIVIGIE